MKDVQLYELFGGIALKNHEFVALFKLQYFCCWNPESYNQLSFAATRKVLGKHSEAA